MYHLYIKITYSCRNVSESFKTSDTTSKKDFLTSILTYFCQKSGRGRTLPPLPFPLGFTDEGRRSPRHALVRSTVERQSTFQSVSGPRLHTLERAGVAGFQSGPLFLSGQLAPHHSGQIPETVALYDTPGKYRGRDI
jgi:hypothetical protein